MYVHTSYSYTCSLLLNALVWCEVWRDWKVLEVVVKKRVEIFGKDHSCGIEQGLIFLACSFHSVGPAFSLASSSHALHIYFPSLFSSQLSPRSPLYCERYSAAVSLEPGSSWIMCRISFCRVTNKSVKLLHFTSQQTSLKAKHNYQPCNRCNVLYGMPGTSCGKNVWIFGYCMYVLHVHIGVVNWVSALFLTAICLLWWKIPTAQYDVHVHLYLHACNMYSQHKNTSMYWHIISCNSQNTYISWQLSLPHPLHHPPPLPPHPDSLVPQPLQRTVGREVVCTVLQQLGEVEERSAIGEQFGNDTAT